MATRTITTKLALDGEAEYKAKLQNLNAEIRLHKSELERVTAEYAGQLNSLEALQAKETALGGQLGAVNQKYEAHSNMLEKARTAQAKYVNQIAVLRAQLDALRGAAGDTADEEAALAEELSKAEENLQRAANSVTGYQKSVNDAAKEQAVLKRELEDTRKYLDEARSSAENCASSIDQFGQKTGSSKEAVDTLASALTAAGLVRGPREAADGLNECKDASVAFQSAFTGVSKTVEGTPAQLAEISREIKQMSTDIPATTTEIASVAEAAGQLGIATENVTSFTRVMMDLGESTDLLPDTAAKSLARFTNITGMAAENYRRLGSVIVDLGNNFATSESEITAMGTRLASAGKLARMSEAEIMALAASMSSVGLEAEAGGTAMTQTLTAIEKAVSQGGGALREFARVAGMSAEDFSAAWQSSAITAVQAFISGLGRLDQQGESATLVLDGLGLSGIRQSNMLKSLALASDTLTRSVALANQAWTENTALTEEANKRYADSASKLVMVENAANNAKIAIGDALRPALDEIADAGTAGFQWAAQFIEDNPALVHAIVGAGTALGIFTGGVTMYTVAVKAAAVASDALTAAVTFTPALAGVAAITGLIVALGAYSATLEKVEDTAGDLVDSLEESRRAYEETRQTIQQESDGVLSSVAALEKLTAVENRSAAQKAAMAELVEQLNGQIPDLNLAYDAQTDRLTDLSTGAEVAAASIRELAQALADQQSREADIQRLTELLREQEEIEIELGRARENLAAAQERLDNELAAGNPATAGYETAVESLRMSLRDLEQAQSDNLAAVAELEGKYESASASVAAAGEQITEAVPTMEALDAATKSAAESADALSSALQEQEKSGSLSLETAKELIAAGYESALVIDQETGAVTLNREEYTALAGAKIQAQIATLEVRRESLQAAEDLAKEKTTVSGLTSAYWDAAGAKAAVAYADDIQALDLQIAALQRAQKSLEGYGSASESTVRRSSASAKKVKTQAEEDLAAYKEVKAELDHEKAMELVSERAYYEKLKEYRDQYLTDAGNLSEYRRVTEQIYSYDKALVDQEAALWEKQTQTLVGQLEERMKAAQDQQTRMEQKLAGYGDLFTVKDKRMNLESIQAQIDAIGSYEAALGKLREMNISGSLMDQVLSLGVDEGTQYAEKLIAMGDEKFEEYNSLWEEKQRRAAEIAEEFYRDQLDALSTEYNEKLGDTLSTLTDTAWNSGADTVQGLIDGLRSKEAALYARARAMAEEVSRIFEQASARVGTVSVEPDGSHAGGLPYVPYDGYLAELHRGERVLTAEEAKMYIAQSLPRSYELPPDNSGQRAIGAMLAQAVNAVGTAAQGGGETRQKYVFELHGHVNGKEFYRETIEDYRAVDKANPEVVDDK